MCDNVRACRAGVLLAASALSAAGCQSLLQLAGRGGAGGPSGTAGQGSAAGGAVYYVATTGHDAADGLTAEAALKTVARALRLVGPGDTVAILPGTYHEAVTLEGVGEAANPITIRGQGGRPVFDGQRTLDIGLRCVRCTGVVLETLEFRNYTDIGIFVSFGRQITLRDLSVHDNGFAATLEEIEGYGIAAHDSSQITIEQNEVYRNGPDPQVLDRWLGTGIDTFGNTDVVIRDNHSHDNVGGGLLVEDSVNVLVEGNRITGNNLDASVEEWWDGGIWIDGGHDVTLRNNTIRNNIGPGVEISDEDRQNPYGYVLEANTITDNRYGLFIWNFGTSGLPATNILNIADDNDISNNTVRDYWILPEF